jgi:hypothetical protein
VLFVKPDYWIVADHVFGAGEHELTRLFHFPVKSSAQVVSGAAQTGFKTGSNIRIQVTDDARLELRQGWIPVSDATAQRVPVAALIANRTLPAALGTALMPFADAGVIPLVKPAVSSDPLVVRLQVTFPNGQQDDIAIAAEPTLLKVGSQQAHAVALCVRRGPLANSVIAIHGGRP